MAYTNQANIEAVLGRSLTSYEVSILSMLLTTVDAWINEQTGSSFGTVSSSTRYYDGGNTIINIDPCTDITVVGYYDEAETLIDSYTLNEDFEARPRNENVKSWLHSRIGEFPSGVANIGVTAKFSLGAVPDEITYLASLLVARIFQLQQSGNLKQESIEGYSRTFKEFVANDGTSSLILSKYTKDNILI